MRNFGVNPPPGPGFRSRPVLPLVGLYLVTPRPTPLDLPRSICVWTSGPLLDLRVHYETSDGVYDPFLNLSEYKNLGYLRKRLSPTLGLCFLVVGVLGSSFWEFTLRFEGQFKRFPYLR